MEEKEISEQIRVLEERLQGLKEKTPREGAGGNSAIVFALIVSALIVGAAVIYSNSGALAKKDNKAEAVAEPAQISGMEYVSPVSASDHIRGSIDAPIKLIEFSDAECPFCKRFHETMREIVESYSGKVAWVYRHFPLDGLHAKARKEAEALECANELGGNGKFWEYLDRLFEITPSNDGLNLAELPKIAEYVGLDRAQFEKCLNSGKYAEHVAEDLADAQRSGGSGTPYTIIIGKKGRPVDVINGALPYYTVRLAIEEALR